jgi:hypothetical protein
MLGKSCRRSAHTQSLSAKIGSDSRAHAPAAREVMTMSKPKTELEQRCPSPPYTRWDQRGNPVLLCHLKRINGKSLCLSLETDDPEIAKRHMRLLVPMLIANGRLSADAGALKVYGPNKTGRSRVKKVDAEVRRLQALSEGEYGSAAVATAKRFGCPVGIIHYLAGRRPALRAGTYATRRMRDRRDRGKKMPMGDTWEHRRQGGRYFYWNGKVLWARLHVDGRQWQWPLKDVDEVKAAALLAPVRVARERLHRAAAEELNYELGTDAALGASAVRAGARAQFASTIIAAGGPKKLAEFVLKGPQEEVGTAVRGATAITVPPTRKTLRQIAREKCLESLIGLLRRHDLPPQGTVPAQCEAAIRGFTGLSERAFYNCLREAERITGNDKWGKAGRRRE